MAAVEGEACEARAEAAVSEVESLVEGGSEGVSVEQDFCVEILPLIREAQNQHGLRHGDYQRYRLYCTRRMHRIRKSLHFTQGHRHRYHKKAVTMGTVTDSRFLLIPLVCAERAWALGMELKQHANTELRKRFHLLRRLGRAVKHAEDLLALCEGCVRCDARTRLEAQAYCSWMVGHLRFEQQCWQEALDAFGQTQTIYGRLSSAVGEEQRSIYTQRVDEISPNVRYCAYNIGDMPTDIAELMKLRGDAPGYDMLASKIDLVLSKTQEKAVSSLVEVTWLGKKVPVRSEKLRLSLVKLQQLAAELGREESQEEKLELFERFLMECQDAVEIARDDVNAETSQVEKKRSQKSEAQRANLQQLVDYLLHMKLSHAIARNLLLVGTMKKPPRKGARAPKPEEFVRVYDILLQHNTDLGDLPGVEEDVSVRMETAARTFSFKAHRCYHLAESYALQEKWTESLGLFDRATEHVLQALEHFRALSQERVDQAQVSELQELQDAIRGRKCEVHVSAVLPKEGVESKMADLSLASAKPLSERAETFLVPAPGQQHVLVPIPPDYRPVPCKPLFFDLALNHVEFPPLGQRVEKKAGGITGFMKGLLWGSKP